MIGKKFRALVPSADHSRTIRREVILINHIKENIFKKEKPPPKGGRNGGYLDCMVDTRKNLRVCQPQNLTVNTIPEYNDISVLRVLTISVPYS